jgi:hypothetical protein
MFKILFQFTVAASIGMAVLNLVEYPTWFKGCYSILIAISSLSRIFIDKEHEGQNIYIEMSSDEQCDCENCKNSRNEH